MSREGPQVENSVTRFTSKSKWGHDPEPCESWRHAAQPAPHFREGLALERGADVWGGREKKGRGVFSTVPARPRRLRATGQPCRSASRERKASEERHLEPSRERTGTPNAKSTEPKATDRGLRSLGEASGAWGAVCLGGGPQDGPQDGARSGRRAGAGAAGSSQGFLSPRLPGRGLPQSRSCRCGAHPVTASHLAGTQTPARPASPARRRALRRLRHTLLTVVAKAD